MASRVLRLWAMYARMDLIWLLKDTRTFAVCTITEIVANVAGVMGIWLIADRFAGIGSLSLIQVVFMLGYSLTVGGLNNMVFGYNTLHISRRIGRGQFDHVMLQPQPVWTTLLTEGFLPASTSAMFISGLGVITYAISRLGIAITPAWLALVCFSIVCSAAISVAYSFMWGSMAFRSPVAAEEVCTSVVDLFSGLSSMPLGGLPGLWQYTMLSVIPVGLCAWFPSVSLLSGEPIRGLAFLALAVLVYGAITTVVFTEGMRYYARAGAYRYFDRGHRR